MISVCNPSTFAAIWHDFTATVSNAVTWSRKEHMQRNICCVPGKCCFSSLCCVCTGEAPSISTGQQKISENWGRDKDVNWSSHNSKITSTMSEGLSYRLLLSSLLITVASKGDSMSSTSFCAADRCCCFSSTVKE
jgi:hypothetical protein